MGATLLLSLCLLAALLPAAQTTQSDIQIPNGHPISSGELPYHATVLGHYFYCGGSIIGTRWILTTASCILRAVTPFLYVLVGRVDTTSPKNEYEQTVEVKRLFIHHKFNRTTLENNIALLHLVSPLMYSDYVSDISTPDQTQNPSPPFATVSGFVHNHQDSTSAVWSVVVSAEYDEQCKGYYQDNAECFQDGAMVYADENFCSITNYTIPFVHYEGDPVVIQLPDGSSLQIGIISYIMECKEQFSVYTEVHHYADWISESMGLSSAVTASSGSLTFLALVIAKYHSML